MREKDKCMVPLSAMLYCPRTRNIAYSLVSFASKDTLEFAQFHAKGQSAVNLIWMRHHLFLSSQFNFFHLFLC